MGTKGKKWQVLHRQKYNNILTKEVLLNATLSKKSDYRLAKELNIPVTGVQFYRKKYNLPSPRCDKELVRIRATNLTNEQIGLIVGTVLGDANLHLGVNNEAFLTIEQGEKQKDYVFEKYSKLETICLMNPREVVGVQGYKVGSKSWKFSTIQHSGLTKIYNLMYKDGKKVVTKEALNLLTLAGLAWWYFDDGSYHSLYKQYNLATCQFSLEEQKLIRNFLFQKFKIKTSILPKKNQEKAKYYYLYFAKETSNIFTQYLKPFVIPCLEYKVNRSSETKRETQKCDDIVRTL